MTTFALMGAKSGTEVIDDITMYYEIYGEGEPLLFFHGGGSHIGHLCYQLPLLANNYRVIAPENRGHRRTTLSSKPPSYHLMAEDAVALMDRLEIESAIIIGASDGGVISLDIAIHHPERVRKLIPLCANFHTDGLTEKTRKHIEEMEPDPEKAAAVLKKSDAAVEDPELLTRILGHLRHMWLTEPQMTHEQLGSISCPTLVMAGDHDAIKLEHTIELFQSIPNAELMIVPGGSHAFLWEHPTIVNEAILDFLRSDTRKLLMPG